MTCHRVFASLLVILSTGASLGYAQTVPQDPRKDAKAHFGPLYLTPTFSLRDFGIDSNVFSESENPRSDFTFVATPGTVLAIPMARRALVRSKLGLDFVYYNKFTTERSVDPSTDVRAEFYTPHVTLFVQQVYVSTKQRQNYEIDLRTRQKLDSFSGGFEIKFSPRSSVEIAAGSSRRRFDGDAVFRGTNLQQELDRNMTNYSATLKSRRTPKTTLLLLTEVTHDRFVNASLRNSDTVRILPGVEFAPRALISGKASVGFRRFHTLSPTVPGYAGLVASLDLGYTLLGATRFAVQADRDVEYSYLRAQPYYLVNGLGFTIRRQLFGDYDTIVGGRRYRYSYRADSSQVTPAPLAETTSNFSVDIGYRLRSSSRIGFAATRWQRSSGLGTDRNFEGWRLGVSFTYGQ